MPLSRLRPCLYMQGSQLWSGRCRQDLGWVPHRDGRQPHTRAGAQRRPGWHTWQHADDQCRPASSYLPDRAVAGRTDPVSEPRITTVRVHAFEVNVLHDTDGRGGRRPEGVADARVQRAADLLGAGQRHVLLGRNVAATGQRACTTRSRARTSMCESRTWGRGRVTRVRCGGVCVRAPVSAHQRVSALASSHLGRA